MQNLSACRRTRIRVLLKSEIYSVQAFDGDPCTVHMQLKQNISPFNSLVMVCGGGAAYQITTGVHPPAP
jgi:hypothetical protein